MDKIIKASAGTGKTYRLSLEYIGLLLKYHLAGIHFNEILVITFTKKATAEIRERIYEHLHNIINNTPDGKILCENIKSTLHLDIGENEREILKKHYHHMLLNKNLVKISTIDSFTNEIFKTIISPYLGLTDYIIDNTISEETYTALYKNVLEDKGIRESVRSFFLRSNKKTIKNFENFFKSLLNKRWIFDFIQESGLEQPDEETARAKAAACLQEFLTGIDAVFNKFSQKVMTDYPAHSVTELFNQAPLDIFIGEADTVTAGMIAETCRKRLTAAHLLQNYKAILDMKNFWNGAKLFRKKDQAAVKEELMEEFAALKKPLAEYIYYSEALTEEKEITALAQTVFKKYDELVFREKKFTHSDISYYTFKYLYEPELSLIDQYSVTNAFYEYLSTHIRFIMIDEFQDTSMLQFKILLPIIKEITSGFGVKEYGGVIIVGDEKQSIYGWRGGERDLLNALPHVLNEYEDCFLGTSYRSDNIIIDFINKIFTNKALEESSSGINWPYSKVESSRNNNQGFVHVTMQNYNSNKDNDNDIEKLDSAIRDFAENVLLPLVNDKKINPAKSAILARKNRDLETIAAVFDEVGLDYILESSSSVFNHRAIKPVMYLLNFVVYQEITELLKFFRSDLVLMNTRDLKEILVCYKKILSEGFAIHTLLSAQDNIAPVKKLNSFLERTGVLSQTPETSGILAFIQLLLKEYNITGIFPQENDIININLFLELTAGFEKKNQGVPQTLKGFLDYCADNQENENFKQLGLDEKNAINLLTIHKSKGLEYESVFLFWNLSSRSSNSRSDLNTYMAYHQDYSGIEQYHLNFNYDAIIEYTDLSVLKEKNETREKIEELDNLYVALTRAKKDLFIYCTYSIKGGLEKLFEKEPTVELLMFKSILQTVGQSGSLVDIDVNKTTGNIGELKHSEKAQEITVTGNYTFLDNYIEFDKSRYFVEDTEKTKRDEYLDFSSVYIRDRDIDKGNIIHFFLSHIKTATRPEIDFAMSRTISYFGNLLTSSVISELLEHALLALEKYRDFFSEKWDRIFTEQTLFSQSGKELRPDRLLVDMKNNEIVLVDFKTGEYYDQAQMNEYIQAVQNLPIVKRDAYSVSGKFIEIPLS